jgi:PleD family two-component response regulator
VGWGGGLFGVLVVPHGGVITAANRTDGPGALFSITLPLHASDQQERPVAPSLALPNVSSPPLNGLRVLLLDGGRDTRELLSVVLQQRGAAVRIVASMDAALELLESWRPDVLVSDAMPPEGDAYALVGKVHSLDADRGGRIPALALTSLAPYR